MIDTRAVGQELQEQVLAAARKGRRRVTTTARNVTATAQMIRPQLPAMPTIKFKLPSADQLAKLSEAQFSQLRERVPALIGRLRNSERLTQLTERQLGQLREKAPGLLAKLPDADQIKASATDLAEQMQSVQRQVADRVRTVASPLAQQAAAAFAQAAAQVSGSVAKLPTAAVTSNGTPRTGTSKTSTASGTAVAADAAKADQPARTSRPAAKAKPVHTAEPSTSTRKKSKPATK
jgi:hypothetical protein